MSAKLSSESGRVAPVQIARIAAKATAAGATIALMFAGTAIPAAAAETTNPCGPASSLGVVTCIYDDPAITNYALRVPAGVTDMHIEARGAAGGDGGTIDSRIPAPTGGHGGFVAADFPVVPGDLLHVLVG